MNKHVVAALTLGLAILAAGMIFLMATININPLHVYILPDHFAGEVEVTFEQAGYPPLVQENTAYVYNMPKSGKLNTSTALESGAVEVYYVDSKGDREEIGHERLHGVVSTHSGDGFTKSRFFVGTQKEYDEYSKQR